MKVENLITKENYDSVNNALAIVKQDMALQIAINALNELFFVNKIEFESYGKKHEITMDLLEDVRNLKQKLEKSTYKKL